MGKTIFKKNLGGAAFRVDVPVWQEYRNGAALAAEKSGTPPPKIEVAEGEHATVSGRGAVPSPGARWGVRSQPLPVAASQREAEAFSHAGALLRIRWRWEGRALHRAALMAQVLNARGEAVRSAVHEATRANFAATDAEQFCWIGPEVWRRQGAGAATALALRLWVYQEGGGTLQLEQCEVVAFAGPRQHGPDLDRAVLVDRAGTSETVLYLGDPSGGDPTQPLAVATARPGRWIAAPWTAAVLRWQPWPDAPVRLLAGPPAAAPAPKAGGTYLFFWGASRYAPTTATLAEDADALRLIRQLGFDGIAFQDNYGLSYEHARRGLQLDAGYLRRMGAAYRAAGFDAPMVLYVSTGLEKGRLVWQPAQQAALVAHAAAVAKAVVEIERELPGLRVVVWPVDEPNSEPRATLAVQAMQVWQRAFAPERLLVTGQRPFLKRVDERVHRWSGFGDWAGSAEPRSGAWGEYGGLDAALFCPEQFGYLAGERATSLGAGVEQAWWHWDAVSGSRECDADGRQEDFIGGVRLADGGWRLSPELAAVVRGMHARRGPRSAEPGTDARRSVGDGHRASRLLPR